MKKAMVLVGLFLLATGLLAFFTSSISPPVAYDIEQADILIAISRNDGTTINRSKPFRGAIVISPDDYATLEVISRQDGLSATFIQCDATLIDGKLEQTRCYRGFDHDEVNMIDVNGSIVTPEGEDKTSASDSRTQINCSALVTNGKIKSTSCTRMDWPKDEFPFAPP